MKAAWSLFAVEQIARVCHEANRALCVNLGDFSQLPWDDAPEWQRKACRIGVVFVLENPEAGPDANHVSWVRQKKLAGWVYGPVKDPDARTHPCMVPFGELPPEQQAKDVLFRAVVLALSL